MLAWLNIGFCKPGGGQLNLALHKQSSQTSTWSSGRAQASSAVDGIRTGEYYSCDSCTHTHAENNPWWMVDLGQHFLINEVVISNRNGINSRRLRNFKIEISEHGSLNGTMVNPILCAERSDPQPGGSTVSYPCTSGAVQGRYLQIRLMYYEILTLCEVQVFGPYYGMNFP
ncbi:fucolectin-like [Liolophura sinensis]|uniref:fucolectin-like n=1 Tax=Liolophura sinensis TaxID=3198878 RepID=UPI00315928F3